MDVFLNGEMVPAEQARLPVDDAGLQHAVGLFETLAAFHGRIFRLRPHLERLEHSARQLGLAPQLEIEPLERAVQRTLEHNELDHARVRLTMTAGSTSLLPRSGERPTPSPTLLIQPSEPTAYDPQYFDRGILVLIAPPAANPFDQLAGHKTLSYWGRLRTLRQAAAAGAGEAIRLNVSNHLADGAVSNVVLVKDGALSTPIARGEEAEGGLPAPVRPGVTRETVLELAREMEMPVHKQMLSMNDLLEADEVFLTNSSWQILPVTRVEKQPVAGGEVGGWTRRLRENLLALIEKETGGDEAG